MHILCTSHLLTASVVEDAFSDILLVAMHGTALLLIAVFLRPTRNRESMMFVCCCFSLSLLQLGVFDNDFPVFMFIVYLLVEVVLVYLIDD